MAGELYNVNSTLQGILARRKAEARQAMLDEIAAKQAQSEMDYRAENLKSLQEQRKATADDRIYKNLINSPHSMGDDVSNLGADYLRVGQETGLINKQPDSVITTTESFPHTGNEEDWVNPETRESTQVTPGKGFQFRGRPNEVQDLQRFNRVGEFLEAMKQNPKMTPHERLLGIARAFGGNSLPAGFWNSLEPKQAMGIVGPTGKITQATRPDGTPYETSGNPLLELGFAPQGPQPQYIGTQRGNPVLLIGGVPKVVPVQGGLDTPPGQAPLPIEPKPSAISAANQYPQVLDPATSRALATARQQMGQGWFQSSTNRNKFASLVSNATGNAKVAPSVRDTAIRIIQSPDYAGKSVQQIVTEYQAAGQSGPELDQLAALLYQTLEAPLTEEQ